MLDILLFVLLCAVIRNWRMISDAWRRGYSPEEWHQYLQDRRKGEMRPKII